MEDLVRVAGQALIEHRKLLGREWQLTIEQQRLVRYSAGSEWCSCMTRHRPSILRKHMVNRTKGETWQRLRSPR
jgi:hypothetical protein